jgi:hypothetical protein
MVEDAGEALSEFQDRAFHDLPCKRVQIDEIWSFVHCKTKERPSRQQCAAGSGRHLDLDRTLRRYETDPVVGSRDAAAANHFIGDLANRLASRVQLTSDGHGPYLRAVEDACDPDIDYAMLIKHYGEPVGSLGRYSPVNASG